MAAKLPYRAVLLTKTIVMADTQRELFRIVTDSIECTEEAAQGQGWAETLIWENMDKLPDFTPEPAEYKEEERND